MSRPEAEESLRLLHVPCLVIFPRAARGSCLSCRRAARRQCGAEPGEQAVEQAPQAEPERSDGRPAARGELAVPPCESHYFRKKECPCPTCAGRAESVSG